MIGAFAVCFMCAVVSTAQPPWCVCWLCVSAARVCWCVGVSAAAARVCWFARGEIAPSRYPSFLVFKRNYIQNTTTTHKGDFRVI